MGLINILGNKSLVEIKESPSKKRYELVMESHIKMGNVLYDSKLLYQWEVFLHEATTEYYHFTLLTLEHSLLENNSPALEDIFQATKAMMQMFSEIQVVTDKKGNVIDILNQKEIRERWSRVRKQLISFSGGISLRAEQVYNIPETDVTDKEVLKKRVQAMEFFEVFFGGPYGRSLPDQFVSKRFNTIRSMSYNVLLETGIDYSYNNNGLRKISISGKEASINKNELQKAYKDIPFVNFAHVDFSCSYTGEFLLDKKTEWIAKTNIRVEEFVCPDFNGVIAYELKMLG